MQRSAQYLTLIRSALCAHRTPVVSSTIQTINQTSYVPSRNFAKRLTLNGVTAPSRKKPKSADDGAAKQGRGESLASLSAENELRLQPAVIEVMSFKPEPDTRAEEQKALDYQFMKQCRDRLHRRRILQNDAISRKLRRRWQALNALPESIREACLLEDRTPLPADFPLPRNCWGELVVPEQGGLRGKQLLTAQQVKKILHWEQREKDNQ